jgi:hypothetical protein
VLTRVASSHIRVGTFQFFAARGDVEGVRLLADHVIARHYPDASGYRDLYEKVIARQAALVAQWLCIGFIHGVMNTDNVSIAGETIDYGPCAFMDAYHPETVFSSIDRTAATPTARQPQIGGWNMARLGEALMPLFADDTDEALKQANESLQTYNVPVRPRPDRRLASQAWAVLRAGRRRRARAGVLQCARRQRHRFHARLPPSGEARRVACSRSRRRSMPGAALARAALPGAAGRDDASRRDASGQPGLHPAQPSRRSGARGRDRARRLRSVRGAAGRAGAAVHGATEFAAYAEPPTEQEQRNFRTY